MNITILQNTGSYIETFVKTHTQQTIIGEVYELSNSSEGTQSNSYGIHI
jgi:hypothetical protein